MADSPIRADFLFMKEVLSASFSKSSVSPTPEELERVSIVFQKAGGSWEKVFKGSVESISLLKKTLKAAIDGKQLSKTQRWDA